MEENLRQKFIQSAKGLSSLPSDAVCDDDQLEECKGVYVDYGEIKAIQKPEPLVTVTMNKLVYVFSYGGKKWYITCNDKSLYYNDGALYDGAVKEVLISTEEGDITDVTSVGKTLVVNTSGGTDYFIAKANLEITTDKPYSFVFKHIGNNIPEPKVDFYLDSHQDAETIYGTDGDIHRMFSDFKARHVRNFAGNASSFLTGNNGGKGVLQPYTSTVTGIADQGSWNNLVLGGYSKNKNDVAKNGGFCLPFFIRFGVELYDGSVSKLTNPILLFPSIRNSTFGAFPEWENGSSDERQNSLLVITKYCYLMYKLITDYSDWDDLVSNVVVFVSKGCELYRTSENAICLSAARGLSNNFTVMDGVSVYGSISTEGNNRLNRTGVDDNYSYTDENSLYNDQNCACLVDDSYLTLGKYSYTNDYGAGSEVPFKMYYSQPMFIMKRRAESAIINELKETSVFYRIADLGITPDTEYKNLNKKLPETGLQNLEEMEQVEDEDYYSHTTLIAENMYTQNRRLCMFDVTRSFFKGFELFSLLENGNKQYYTSVVSIEADSGEKIVVNKWSSYEIIRSGESWLYYPDPRAKRLSLYRGTEKILNNVKLTEHTGLNGAYYIGDSLPTYHDTQEEATTTGPEITASDDSEGLLNYIIQSEVDNPYTFNAKGYVRVGEGEIIGLAALTTALSQDAYAVAATIVFTTTGIWAASVDDSGYYKGVAPPFSREVCSNPDSITMTDNMVFFVTRKGLMCINGTSEGAITCVSENMSGRGGHDFIGFLQTCKIAYDYKSSMLILYQEDSNGVWVYNIKNQTFAYKENYVPEENNISTIVADYPDYIVQGDSGKLYSLLDEPEADADPSFYSGTAVTRPLKLDEAYALKSLRQIEPVSMLSQGTPVTEVVTTEEGEEEEVTRYVDSTCKITVFASNDLRTWIELDSIKGSPFKYYKLKYAFENLRAIDTFTGCMLTYTTRRDYGKLR